MSWFDAAGIANLAKNALKEAQKAVDKALVEAEGAEYKPNSDGTETQSSVNSLWESFTNTLFERTPNLAVETSAESSGNESATIEEKISSKENFLPQTSELYSTKSTDSNVSPNVGSECDRLHFEKTNTDSSKSSTSDSKSPVLSESVEILGSITDTTPELETDPSEIKESQSYESIEVLSSSSIEILNSSEDPSRFTSEEASSESVEVIAQVVENASEQTVDENDDTSPSGSEGPLPFEQTSCASVEGVPLTSSLLAYTSEVVSTESSTLQRLSSHETFGDTIHENQHSQEPVESGIECRSQVERNRSRNHYSATLDGSSSCDEGTVILSSSEDPCTSDSSLKLMLAEAMVDRVDNSFDPTCREESLCSSERTEHGKVCSSGHTSGDELETATSSDIEIISSPNGGNGTGTEHSNANSRQSPAKLIYKSSTGKMSVIAISDSLVPEISGKYISFKMSGNNSAPSETSSGCSDDTSEIDGLLKKIAELSETLEARESKLIDLSMKNAELSENNSNLKSQLEYHTNEEYSQRLAALEKKFQQAIRERDTLRRQLESHEQNSECDDERDQIIRELREEGEKLSKQQLAATTLIKKLRASETDHLAKISTWREKYNDAMQEIEKMKNALSTKDSFEQTQQETIKQLTKSIQKSEKRIVSLQSQVDGLSSALVSVQKELEDKEQMIVTLKKEIEETASMSKKQSAEEFQRELNVERKKYAAQQDTITQMRRTLLNIEQQHFARESSLKEENSKLMRNLEDIKQENENLKEQIVVATRSVVKQLTDEIAKNNKINDLWTKKEHTFVQKINELQEKLKHSEDIKTKYLKQYDEKSSELAATEQAVLKIQNDFRSMENMYNLSKGEIDALKAEIFRLQQIITSSSPSNGIEKRETCVQTELLSEDVTNFQYRDVNSIEEPYYPPSPTLKTRRTSLSDSVSSTEWPMFVDDEPGSASSQIGSLYDGCSKPIATATSLLENLQAQIKQRDGEVQQLQWELKRRDHERDALTNEIAKLSHKVDELEPCASNYKVLQRRYDELLQMYGEKAEAYRELEMDVQDIKEIHKLQIMQLIDKQCVESTTEIVQKKE